MNYKINDFVKVTAISRPDVARFYKNRVGRIYNIKEIDGKILYTIVFPWRKADYFEKEEFVLATDDEIRNTLIKLLEAPF